ncbi:class I adenylate-forming enzyme family protein [Arthrobacter sp. 08Y14]|uniref:class I adenylate-forming enzyme family protein n=1 Tax=Arthrobacter sp. 08Y14 TaxID=2058885 RepID=UPI001CA574A2|nr:AMP-binding protein [Arthrobacter sp. 08Y14]
MEIRSHTFAETWAHAVAAYGKQTFLVFRSDAGKDTSYSYADFDLLVVRTAGRLAARGVVPGSRVHVALRNSPAFLLVWLALAKMGAVLVAVDPASTAQDIAKQIKRTAPVLGIAADGRRDTYEEGARGLLTDLIFVSEDEGDALDGAPLLGESRKVAAPQAADQLALLFTSGTTSEPKAVVLTQANYAYIAKTMAELIGLRESDRWLVTLPLFHGNAQFYCFSSAIHVGASVALTSRFSASNWVRHAQELQATHASLFAAPIRMILARTPADTIPIQLQHVWFAQSLGSEHYGDFAELVGCLPRQLYGMTETTAIVTADLSATPRSDTIGTVIPGREIYLADPVDLVPVAPGTPGVVMVSGQRGITLFCEYLDNPAANDTAFVNVDGREWFRTGDLAEETPDGHLKFVGRIDDVIKVAGENVSLTEVEAAVAQAPGVLEAAVLSREDPIRDHVPVAYVVRKPGATECTGDSLSAWADAHLVPQARPREWHFIDELPRTSVGKIRRFKLASTR